MEQELTPLSLTDTFSFNCHNSVSCFNECCKDLNQFLTPYDILRLKSRLNMSSQDFLSTYVSIHTGPETGLPVASFKTDPMSGFKCPFVSDQGCQVYPDRPSSCRTYPLVRMASRSRETGKISEHYYLMQENHCLGFQENHSQTVAQWIEQQGIGPFNEMNDRFMEIIALKNRFHPNPLDIRSSHFFHMACYDLDAFREHVFEKDILKGIAMDPELKEQAASDDTKLLQLGFEWIKHTLFSGK